MPPEYITNVSGRWQHHEIGIKKHWTKEMLAAIRPGSTVTYRLDGRVVDCTVSDWDGSKNELHATYCDVQVVFAIEGEGCVLKPVGTANVEAVSVAGVMPNTNQLHTDDGVVTDTGLSQHGLYGKPPVPPTTVSGDDDISADRRPTTPPQQAGNDTGVV